MFMNVGFVAREYVQDDEVTASELEDQFGGDSYCVSRNALYLGLSRSNDGCEPLDCSEQKPDDILDEEVGCDDLTREEMNRSREAVAEAIALQKFFRLRKEQEEYDARIEAEDKLRAVTCQLNASAQIANRDVEVVEIWQMRQVARSYGGSCGNTVRRSKNSRRPMIGDHGGNSYLGYTKIPILAEVVVGDRRYRVSRAA